MRRHLTTAVIVCFLFGCGGGASSRDETVREKSQLKRINEIEFVRIPVVSGDVCQAQITDEEYISCSGQQPTSNRQHGLIIKNNSDWSLFLSTNGGTNSDPITIPIVDFTKNMVAGAAGMYMNGCGRLEITHILRNSDGINIEYSIYSAVMPDAACTQAITAVADFVSLPLSDLPVTFSLVQPGG